MADKRLAGVLRLISDAVGAPVEALALTPADEAAVRTFLDQEG